MTNARDKANIPVLNFQSKGIDDNADATAITIDSAENVGIGVAPTTTSASGATIKGLVIGGNNATGVYTGLQLLNRVENSTTSNGIAIDFDHKTSGSTTIPLARVIAKPSSSTSGDLQFYTSSSSSLSERMRLNSTGLALKTSAPAVTLDVRATSFTPYNTNTSLIVEAPAVFSQAQHFYIYNAGSYNSSRPTGGIGAVNASSLISLSAGSICNANPGADGFKATATTSSLYDIGSGNHEFKTKTGLTVGDQFTHVTRMIIKDSGSVGIGTSAPDGTLHVQNGSAGSVTAYSGSNLTLEASGSNNFLSFLSPANQNQGILFGDADANFRGQVQYSHTNDYMGFFTSASEAMRITSAGNVGILTSAPTLPLEVSGSGLFGGSVIATGSTTTTASRRAIMTHDGSSMKLMASGDSVHRNMVFYRDGGSDEAMRIDTSNRLQVGSSSSLWNMNFNVHQGSSLASEDGYNGTPPIRLYQRTNHTGGLFVEITASDGTRIGSITRASSTSVAYNTTSDYRLKENVVDLDNATTRLKQLKPKRFNFIADADTTVDGFLAHEVSSVVPEAINGEKDEVRDFGNIVDENNNIIEENVNKNHKKEDGHTWVKTETKPVYQGIDQSKLVPLLVKTIQELEARITTLETNNP